jgi:hypothetical protein
MKFDIEAEGISIIPCMGKNNLDRPTIIFQQFGIKTYTIWDSDMDNDSDSDLEANHRLLRLFNEEIQDWPEKIGNDFACFEKDMTSKINEEIGLTLFDRLLEKACEEFCIVRKNQAKKNSQILKYVFQEAYLEGKKCLYLEEIMNKIIKLKR